VKKHSPTKVKFDTNHRLKDRIHIFNFYLQPP
jgi:hypothetical protein